MSPMLRGAMAMWVAAWVLAVARPVFGVIKVELPVSKLIQQSRTVAVGRVSGLDQQRRAVEVEAMVKIKGDLDDVGPRFRVLVAEGSGAGDVGELLKTVTTGGPVVLFISGDREDAVLHMGDRWVRGQRVRQDGEARPGAVSVWRVTQAYDGGRSFPGRTEALADVVREIRAGGMGLQDWVSHEVCLGGVYRRADTGLAGAAAFLLSHDLNGDGTPDVIAGNAEGVRVLVAAKTLWNDGGETLAAAFANDFGDNGRLHAIVVRADSIVRYAAGTGTGAADFARLTGIPLSSYGFLGVPIEPLMVAAYDYDGMGRTDFLLVTQAGGVALANRGHGAFLINRFAHEQFRPGGRDIKLPKLPFEPSLSGTLAAPGRQVQMQPKRKRGNLLVLTDKGELWEMDNERRR